MGKLVWLYLQQIGFICGSGALRLDAHVGTISTTRIKTSNSKPKVINLTG